MTRSPASGASCIIVKMSQPTANDCLSIFFYMLMFFLSNTQEEFRTMKKFLISVIAASCMTTAFAYEKGEMYIAPALGYHFFDEDHDLDDAAEPAIRVGKFLSERYALEGEFAYANADKDGGGEVNATTLSLNSLIHFNLDGAIRPYLLLGLGGMFYDDDHAGVIGGVGAKVPFNDMVGLDLRVKDMFMTDTRNDIVPSVALTVAFGKPAPVVAKVAEPVKAEPAPAPAEVEKAPEPAAVAVAPADSDKDGVYDDADKCPGTPEGAPVDSVGCPLDSDGDGVYDYLDKCPGTKKGYKVNAEGCFIAATLNVNFKTNSADIADGYDQEISDFAEFLKANPSVHVEIQGHTDSAGKDAYNQKLSQKRADSIVKELINKYGIESSRLTAVGYGETQPIAPNDTPENMLKNRRIETVVK